VQGSAAANRGGWIALIAILIVAAAARFYRLPQSPPGFFRDEAAVAAQTICLSQSGRTLDGSRWPLMTPVLGGGYSTIAWQGPAVAWSRVAGTSIGAARSFAALCGVLLIGGVFLFARFATGSKQVAAYSALAAAISPWAFQFSRISWDPAIAPAYLAWALAALFLSISPRATESRFVGWLAVVASAMLFAAACISYPPLRVQVPLVMLAFLVWKRDHVRAHPGRAATFAGVFVMCVGWLLLLTGSGAIQARFDNLSVFNAGYWARHGATSGAEVVLRGTGLVVRQFFAHFTPAYLLISGDASVRHSTQSFGIWSWLDALALAGAAALLLRARRPVTGWVGFAAVGYLSGILPAALTREGVPHALRSIGALPFLAVLVGTAIDAIGRELPRLRPMMPMAASVVATIFATAFWRVFFVSYPTIAGNAFDTVIAARWSDPKAAQADISTIEQAPYPLLASRYYELRAGAVRCVPDGRVLVRR
jgi:hypothetical protein